MFPKSSVIAFDNPFEEETVLREFMTSLHPKFLLKNYFYLARGASKGVCRQGAHVHGVWFVKHFGVFINKKTRKQENL